jgi:hypothetical protein
MARPLKPLLRNGRDHDRKRRLRLLALVSVDRQVGLEEPHKRSKTT